MHASERPGRRAGRGRKNPDVGKIIALCPDLAHANAEENRLPDLDALREARFAVCVGG